VKHSGIQGRFVISFTHLSQKLAAFNWKKWIWIGLVLAALAAVRIYYVREMLAALILFSVLFVGVSAVVLAILLLVRASKPVIAWAAPKIGSLVDGGFDAFKGVAASPAWARAVPQRFRREQLKGNARNSMVSLRFAAIRVYRIGLRAGVVVLTTGLSAQKRVSRIYVITRRTAGRLGEAKCFVVRGFSHDLKPFGMRTALAAEVSIRGFSRRLSNRLGPWLTERVSLRPLAWPRGSGDLLFRIRRLASPHSNFFPRRPRKKIVRMTSSVNSR
jgi:hypothetical protein